jgi:hypothetical protein
METREMNITCRHDTDSTHRISKMKSDSRVVVQTDEFDKSAQILGNFDRSFIPFQV